MQEKSGQKAVLERRKANLKLVLENHSATALQTAMRNKIARDKLKFERYKKASI
jgi:hypothetical protein